MRSRIQPVGKYLASTSGLSLLEILVAVAFLGIALVAIIGLGSSGLQRASISRNVSLADQYAREGVEMLRSYRDNKGWSEFRRIGGFSSDHPIWGQNYSGTAAPSCVVTNADRYYFAFLLPAHGVATPVAPGVRAIACGSEATFDNPSTYQHQWLNNFCKTSVWLTQPTGNPVINGGMVVENFYRAVIIGYENDNRAFVRSVVCYYEGPNVRGIQIDSYLTNWR